MTLARSTLKPLAVGVQQDILDHFHWSLSVLGTDYWSTAQCVADRHGLTLGGAARILRKFVQSGELEARAGAGRPTEYRAKVE